MDDSDEDRGGTPFVEVLYLSKNGRI